MGIVCQGAFFEASARGGDIADSVRAYWTFDAFTDANSDGPTYGTDYFEDQSANGRDIVIQKEGADEKFANLVPYSSSGVFGNAFRAENGSSNNNEHIYMEVPSDGLTDNLNFLGSDDSTVSLWTNVPYTSSWGDRGFYYTKGYNEKYDFEDDSQGYTFFRHGGQDDDMIYKVGDGAFGLQTVSTSNPSVPFDDHKWALWTITRDGTTGLTSVYVNGVLDSSSTINPTNDDDWVTDAAFNIAGRKGAHQRAFVWAITPGADCLMDDFAVIGSALSAAQVAASNSLALDADLIATNGVGYDMGSVLKLLDVHVAGGGGDVIGSLAWTYSDTLTGVAGDVTGAGSAFTLVLDDTGGAGAMTGVVSAQAKLASSTAVSTSWFAGTTWSSGLVPDAVTVVAIDSTDIVNVDTADGDAFSVSVIDTAQLTIDATRTLTTVGNVDVGAMAKLTINGALDAFSLTTAGVNTIGSGGSVTLGDSLTVNSAFDVSASTNPLTAPKVTVGAAGSLTLGANLSVAKLSMNGSLAVNGKNLTVTEALNVNSDLDASGGTMTTTGAAVTLLAGTLKVGNSIQADSLSVNGGTLDLAANDLTVASNLEINGTLDMTLANMGSLDVSTANVIVQSGSLKVNEAMTASSLTYSGGTFDLGGQNLTVGDMTLSQSLDMGAGALAASNSITLNGAALTVSNAVSTPALTIASGNVAGPSITADAYAFTDVNYAGDLTDGTGASTLIIGENASADHLVKLTGASNTYTGTTTVRRGFLEVDADAGNLGDGKLIFQAYRWDYATVLQTSGDFSRTINAADGVYWQDAGGFAATDASLTVTLARGDANAALPLDWSSGDNGFHGTTIHMNSPTSTASVELTNDIEIDSTTACQVYVYDNPATDTDVAILSGDITRDGTNNRNLRKFGDGTLVLTGTNDFGTGWLQIQGGSVRAEDGVGLPTAAVLYLQGGTLETSAALTGGTFTREIGSGSGQVYWNGSAGFAAHGGALTVTLTPAGGLPGGQLTWGGTGSNTTGFNGKNLVLGSRTANEVVTLTNPIDAGNSNRDMYLYDNPYSDADRGVLAGDVTGLKRLRLYKGGTLEIAQGAILSQDGGDGGAEIEMYDGTTLIVNGTVNLADDLVFKSAGETLGGSGKINTYSIGTTTTKIDVNSGRYLTPGDGGTGTLTIETGTGDEFQMGGSTYLWEVGQPGSTDILKVTGAGTLDINDITLKISDDDGYVASDTDELPVFTYDAGTTIVEALGTITINPDDLDGTWTIGTLALTDGGSGTIYLTGLSGGTPDSLIGDADGNGVVNADDYMALKRNMGTSTSATLAMGNFDTDDDVDFDDLQLLIGNYDAVSGGAPAVPEPATLCLLAVGAMAVIRRRRRS